MFLRSSAPPLLCCLAAASLLTPRLPAGEESTDISRHLYPKATQRLAVIDMDRLRDSGLFTEEITNGFEEAVKNNENLNRVMTLLEAKPEKIHRFTFCETTAGGPGRPPEVLFIMHGTYPYEKASAGLAALAKSGELTGLSVNDLPVYFNHRTKRASYFALVDEHTLIVSEQKKLIDDAVQGLTDLREPDKGLVGKLDWQKDAPAVARLAGAIPPEAKTGLARVPQFAELAKELVGYNAVMTLGEAPTVRVRLTMTGKEKAEQTKGVLDGLVALGKVALAANPNKDAQDVLDKLKLSADGADVCVDLTVTEEFLSNLVIQGRKDRERFRERRRRREAERAGKEGKDAPKTEAAPKKETTKSY